MANPFFVGGAAPPERFFGRRRELDMAVDQIANRGHVAFYGSSGMGKSSLLGALAAPQTWNSRGKDPALTVMTYLDCRGPQPFEPSAFWRRLLELISLKCRGDAALEAETAACLQESKVGHPHLRRVATAIGEQNKRLLLLLDGYDTAVTPYAAYTEVEMQAHLFEFRTLLVEKALSVVAATSRRLSEMGPAVLPAGSPWYNQYLIRPLQLLRERDVAKLFSALGRHNIPAIQEAIWELSGGHPALLQQACSLLYEALEEGRRIEADAFSRDFERNTRDYHRDAWRSCTAEEQMLLTLIALSRLEGRTRAGRKYDLGDLDVLFSQKDRELRDLEERGLIRRDPEDDSYAFTSSIMEWWVVKKIENSNAGELAEREKIFSGVTRKQLDKIKNVMTLVWNHKDAIKSVVGYAGKLAGAFTKGLQTG